MALNPSTAAGRIFGFRSQALPADVLYVASLEGEEAISRPFRFELDLLSAQPDLDPALLLAHEAHLRLKAEVPFGGGRGTQSVEIHGVLSSFEFRSTVRGAEGATRGAIYRAVLVPRLWRLSLSHRTRSFRNRTLPEIAAEVLRDGGLSEDDFEFPESLLEKSEPREYVVQHQETDLNFLSRLLEHEGIFFTFDHRAGRDRIVFREESSGIPPLPGRAELPFLPETADPGAIAGVPAYPADISTEEGIRTFGCRQSLVTAKIVLRDYDPSNPSKPLEVSAEVDPKGFGTTYLFGEHFTTEEEGKALAAVRAQEIRCRARTFVGTSDSRAVHAGHTFTLSGHPRAPFNRKYLVVEVRHAGQQDVTLAGLGAGGLYGNRFTLMPAEVPFRPSRLAPKPRVAGGLNARIDAAGDGKYAEIDAQGRYRLRVLHDLAEPAAGQASPPVRMLQPYAGNDFGTHFPLLKGTEVIVAHENGDPDRPIIAGAVPNAENESPVRDGNSAQTVIKSAGKNALVFDDTEEQERLLIRAERSLELRANEDAHAMSRDAHVKVNRDRYDYVDNDEHRKVGGDARLEVGCDRHLIVGGNSSADITGQLSLKVQGDEIHRAANLVLAASGSLTLQCGASCIVLDSSGVTVKGGKVYLNSPGGPEPLGAELLSPKAPKPPVEPGDLDAGVTKGQSAGGAAVGVNGAKTSWISLELRDKKGRPIADEFYLLKLPDGEILSGRLDKDGKARVEGLPAGACEVMFPRIDDGKWRKA